MGHTLSWLSSSSASGTALNYNFLCSPIQEKTVGTSGSIAGSGDIYMDNSTTSYVNVSDPAKRRGLFFGDKKLFCFRKAGLSLNNQELTNMHLTKGFFISGIPRRTYHSRLLLGSCLMNSRIFSSLHGAAADVSFDISPVDEQLGDSEDSSEQSSIGKRAVKLISGSCYIPHPLKEETGGEDAHFICVDEQVIGIADGVGGWADVGVDAGEYARELMSNSVAAILEEPKGSVDPARVLEKAHSVTQVSGSSTACIIALTNQQGIHAINIGDSGFVIIRDGSTVFRSPVQQYGFNFPYQLENGTRGDLPSAGQVFRFHAAPGDVIVAGTDGLFDNLYNNEISSIIVNGVRTHMEPEVLARKIAALARERAQDRARQTPFATAAQHAGFRYHGGKLDDITVVVSYVSAASNQ
ncbi:hypothetical protein Nepgr_027107 [Nepenthes gracilis]|uniref:Protein phosphatase n=1 Tax=Nepenthes gracilis TaxID=150966 RepID=A0AAD3TA90_NEPGR|nr:hypothetical protein Nepgr_027107 [Nepenthes gracilis]